MSGYSIRTDKFGMDQWSLLGKRDPLTPQMFYPVVNSDPIRFGDKLVRTGSERYRTTNRPSYKILQSSRRRESVKIVCFL